MTLPPPAQRERVPLSFMLFSDFTNIECYALNEFLSGSPANARVAWKGVQIFPSLPAVQRDLTRRESEQLEDEIVEIRRRVPTLDVTLPRARPSTTRAILAVASVVRLHSAKAIAFRDAVYRAYWRDGADLSSAATLQRIADQAGVPRFVDLSHPAAEDEVEEWEVDFSTERLGGVPRAIRSDGTILWGHRPVEELEAYFGASRE